MGMSSHPDWYITGGEESREPTHEDQEGVRETGAEGVALPSFHTEGVVYAEGMTVADVASHIYHDSEKFGPGLQQEWKTLTEGEDHGQAFKKSYADYLLQPAALRQEHPERYGFIKAHVFDGVEYPDAAAPVGEAYLDYDYLGRQISVNPGGTVVVATGQKIA